MPAKRKTTDFLSHRTGQRLVGFVLCVAIPIFGTLPNNDSTITENVSATPQPAKSPQTSNSSLHLLPKAFTCITLTDCMPDLFSFPASFHRSMQNILVTGGSGFIGSHLVDRLLGLGHHVTVIDDLSTGRAKNLAHLAGNHQLEVIHADLADPTLVADQVARADQVYHLAAAVGVALIASHPIQTIHRNIYPTQLLLEALELQRNRGREIPFFLASTSEVYGKNPKPIWNEEDDLVFGATTRPRWSYGASKAIDEFLALAHHRQWELPVVIGRFFNVVGPRQTGAYGMVLPRFVEAAMKSQPLLVHDDGQQQRCFAHVADVIDAIIELMLTPSAYGRVYNIGSDHPISIVDLAKRVLEIVNPKGTIQFQSYRDAYDPDFEDVRRRVPDLTRLRSTIQARPRHTIDAIIQDVFQSLQAQPTPRDS